MMKRVDTRSRLNKTICLKDEMESFMKHIGLDEKLQELKILDVWKECVGNGYCRIFRTRSFKEKQSFR